MEAAAITVKHGPASHRLTAPATLLSLQLLVHALTGVPPPAQKLISKGKTLQSDAEVAKLKPKAKLLLMTKTAASQLAGEPGGPAAAAQLPERVGRLRTAAAELVELLAADPSPVPREQLQANAVRWWVEEGAKLQLVLAQRSGSDSLAADTAAAMVALAGPGSAGDAPSGGASQMDSLISLICRLEDACDVAGLLRLLGELPAGAPALVAAGLAAALRLFSGGSGAASLRGRWVAAGGPAAAAAAMAAHPQDLAVLAAAAGLLAAAPPEPEAAADVQAGLLDLLDRLAARCAAATAQPEASKAASAICAALAAVGGGHAALDGCAAVSAAVACGSGRGGGGGSAGGEIWPELCSAPVAGGGAALLAAAAGAVVRSQVRSDGSWLGEVAARAAAESGPELVDRWLVLLARLREHWPAGSGGGGGGGGGGDPSPAAAAYHQLGGLVVLAAAGYPEAHAAIGEEVASALRGPAAELVAAGAAAVALADGAVLEAVVTPETTRRLLAVLASTARSGAPPSLTGVSIGTGCRQIDSVCRPE